MGNLAKKTAQAVNQAGSSEFWVTKTITSSTITTSAQDLTTTATGRLFVKQIIVKTDTTGLAGGTNFTILSNNANGVVNILVETIGNLGASATKVLAGVATAADTTTSDGTPTVTSLPTVLEAGKKLQYLNTGGVGTGAGVIEISVLFQRVDANAKCSGV